MTKQEIEARLQDERFCRLSAEVRAQVEPLRESITEEGRRRAALEDEVRQIPNRHEFDRLVKIVDRNRHDAEVEITGAVASLRTDLYGENGIAPKLDAAIGKIHDDVKALQIAPAKRVLAIAGSIAGTALALEAPRIIEWLKTVF